MANTLEERKQGAICLGPTGNPQGTYINNHPQTIHIGTHPHDRHEGRDVAVLDIKGAYFSADMDNEVHLVFRGTLAEIMVMADTALYQPFVSYDTGKPVLYVWLQKALYGCLKSALLFYEKLVGDLETYGFKINP